MDINQRIKTALRQLIAERGFKGWTMDELSAYAHISKRTLYRYYPGKEELITIVIDDFLATMALKVDELIASSAPPQEVVRTILLHLMDQGKFVIGPRSLEDLRSIYPHLWEKIDGFRMERIRTMVDYIMTRNSSSSISDLDPRIIGAAIGASVQAVINPTFILDNNLTFEAVGEQLIRFLLASLGVTDVTLE